jgi:hypothetical protein
MALFAVNTGLRDSNLCGLRWTWEVPIAELGRSVFVIPKEAFKSRRQHVVILNEAAWSIVESRRGITSVLCGPCGRQQQVPLREAGLVRGLGGSDSPNRLKYKH